MKWNNSVEQRGFSMDTRQIDKLLGDLEYGWGGVSEGGCPSVCQDVQLHVMDQGHVGVAMETVIHSD